MYHSNEFILPHDLSEIQNDVLIGSLLGDGSLSKDGKYPRLKIERSLSDLNYLSWQFSIFENFCSSRITTYHKYDKRYNKVYNSAAFRTRAVPAFLKYYDKWYINGIKKIPVDIVLSPLIIAVWIADDGCIINNNKHLILKISTECFGEAGAQLLSSKLSTKYKEKFPIYRKNKDKDQFFIKTSTCAAQAVLKDIQPHIIKMGMIRKYNIWKDFDLDFKPKIGRPKNNEEK